MSLCHDETLSEFMQETGTDASLARDILEGKDWDLIGALKTYNSLWKPTETSLSAETTPTVNGTCTSNTGGTLFSEPDNGIIHNNGIKFREPVATNEMENGHLSDEEEDGNKRLIRGFSKGNENERLLVNARHHLGRSVARRVQERQCHIETPSYTFTLPDFTSFTDDFRRFLEKDLIETSTLKALEHSGHLNWWASHGTTQKLWPLATSGDGNCLLHAASLGMWGFHDRLLILRKALFDILAKGSRRHALFRRWRWQQTFLNKESGLIYSEEEWRHEWNNLVRLASPEPRSKPGSAEPVDPDRRIGASELDHPNQIAEPCEMEGEIVYESLEEVHVFALAHVLKRPVIVVADTVLRDSGGEAFAPIPFGGIYLPLECPSAECHRSPLVLSYDTAHFSALVLMQQKTRVHDLTAVIPITDRTRKLLPLHFASDPGPDFTWWSDAADDRIARMTTLTSEGKLQLISRYLDIYKLPLRRGSNRHVEPLRLEARASTLPSSPKRTLSPTKQKRRISVSRWARLIRKTFQQNDSVLSPARTARKFSLRRKSRDDDAEKVESSESGVPVSLLEVQDVTLVVGAMLNAHYGHQYMEEMVSNYLKAARQRFDSEQKALAGKGAGGKPAAVVASGKEQKRDRISRSFSASNLVVSCMNGECPRVASTATNFLCEECFRTQKELMTSFSTHQTPTVPRAHTACAKSHTLPSFSGETLRSSQSSLRVRETAEAPKRSNERTYGVNAVTTSHGVTHYYIPTALEPDAEPLECCKRLYCKNYSNGHPDLCSKCSSLSPR